MSLPEPEFEERDDKQNNEQNQTDDFVRGDQVGGDNVGGDKTGGDKLTAGNVSNANVAMGEGAQVNITNNYIGTDQTPDPQSPVPTPQSPFHINFPKNTRFQGRETELTALHNLLQASGPDDIKAVGINSARTHQSAAGVTGMGGIGKTQLAVEYAYRHRDAYTGGIFLINAAVSVQPQLVDAAKLLNLKVSDPERADINDQLLTALRDYLHEQPKTLLIFDNVEEPDLLLRTRFGPGLTLTALGGTLLITTRTRQLPTQMQAFSLDTLENDHAAAKAIITKARPDLVNDEMLDDLCERLGFLPLALNLAACLLADFSDLTIHDYLAELNKWGLDKLNAEADVAALEDYEHKGLRPVLQVQWERLLNDTQNADIACKLFKAASQLDRAAIIPIARLSLFANIANTSVSKRPLSRALLRLETLYFIERLENEKIRLHPLVQEFSEYLFDNPQTQVVFRQECAANMASAYENLSRMVDECFNRGVEEAQIDLIVALFIIQPNHYPMFLSAPKTIGQRKRICSRLETLQRLLQREAHSLIKGTSKTNLAQQIVYRVANHSINALNTSAQDLLTNAYKPFLKRNWGNPSESFAIERILRGHDSSVNAIAVVNEGHKAISASNDKTLIVWSLMTGKAEQSLMGHTHWVNAVAAYNDDRTAISASHDRTLIIWNLETGEAEQTLTGHDEAVWSVAVFDDGRKAISASHDKTLIVWSLETGEAEKTLRGHKSSVWSVAVFDDGRKALSASHDETLIVWNLETGEAEKILRGHEGKVSSVAVFQMGGKAISASYDETLIVWNLKTGEPEKILRGHEDLVTSVALINEDCQAISGSKGQGLYDGTLTVWDLETGEAKYTLHGHEGSINAVAATDDDCKAISASADGTLKVWNLEAEETEQNRFCHDDSVSAIAILRKDYKAISVAEDKSLKIWNLKTGEVEKTLRTYEKAIWSVAVFDDGRKAIAATGGRGAPNGTLVVWDLHTGEIEQTFTCYKEAVWSVAIFNKERSIISASGKTLKIWNLETGELERSLSGHNDSVKDIAVFEEGRKAISASRDKMLKVWNLETGNIEQTLRAHKGLVNSVAVYANGRKAISASDDKTLKVWNLQTGEEEMTLSGHQESVNSVEVFDEGRKAISASSDRSIKVWDLVMGKEIVSIVLDGAMTCVDVYGDDNSVTIVAGDRGGGIYCLEYVEPNDDKMRLLTR